MSLGMGWWVVGQPATTTLRSPAKGKGRLTATGERAMLTGLIRSRLRQTGARPGVLPARRPARKRAATRPWAPGHQPPDEEEDEDARTAGRADAVVDDVVAARCRPVAAGGRRGCSIVCLFLRLTLRCSVPTMELERMLATCCSALLEATTTPKLLLAGGYGTCRLRVDRAGTGWGPDREKDG